MTKKNISKDTIQIYILTGMLTLCSYIVLPFLALYFTSQNLSVTQVGIILGVSSFVSAISGIISPCVENRLGTKKTMFLSVLLVAVCYFLISITNRFFFDFVYCYFTRVWARNCKSFVKKDYCCQK